jgi:serine/threonine-protein kinase ATR
MIKMAKELLYLCDYNVPRETKHLSVSSTFPELLSLAKQGEIILPMQSSLSVTMPPTGTADPHFQIFADDLPRIVDLDNTVEVLSSLQRPRKLLVKSSDGQVRAFLCKPNDDLRKDARLMEFDGMINNLLQSNPESRKRRLYIRTYAVVTLNEECGLIEWVPNTVGLRHVLQRLYALRGIPLYTQQVKQDLELACKDPKRAGDIFEKKVLSSYPPVFNEWLLAEFPEPSAWLSARLKYGRTLAVMSMVGYVLGLGDRHGENILFDSVSGDTVHVDLNCLFERGATFEVPERVPFRLTQNLVDALGVTGVEGVFRKAAEISMAVLRENRESLTSVLEAMVHDPLVE